MPADFEDFWKPKQDEKMKEINEMNIYVNCKQEYEKQFDKFFA